MTRTHISEINNLEKALKDVTPGEPVLLFHQVYEGFDYILLYQQPEGEIGVEYEAFGETAGDQQDLYDIDVIGLSDPVYHIWYTQKGDLEYHKKPTAEKVRTTGYALWEDDFVLVSGEEDIRKVLGESKIAYMDDDFLPLVEQYLSSL